MKQYAYNVTNIGLLNYLSVLRNYDVKILSNIFIFI